MTGSPFDSFARPRDPHERYLVEIQSLVVGVFKEAHGLDAEREEVEIEEGGREERISVPGPYAQGSFVLREGETDGPELYRWYEKSRDGDHLASSRRTGAVILVDGRGVERMRWRFRAALISVWEGPQKPPRDGRPFTIEAIEITHEGLEPVFRTSQYY